MPGLDAPSLRRAGAPAGLAAALVLAAVVGGALTWDGERMVVPAAWLIAAVLGASVFAGIAGGLASSLLATAAMAFWFVAPTWSLRIDDGADARATAAFAAVALLIALAVDAIETARRRADDVLVEQAGTVALLESVIDDAPVGIALFDADLRFLRVNEELLRLNGLELADHLGRHVDEVLPDPRIRESIERALATGRPVLDVAFRGVHRRTGSPQHVSASYYPVRDADGTVVGVGAVVHDTTGRVAAERERELVLERLTRLQAATAALAMARSTDDVVAAVLAEVRRALGGSGVSLALREGDDVLIVAGDGYDPAELERWRTFPVAAPIPIAEAIRTGRIITSGDRLESAARWPAIAGSLGDDDRALAALPLVVAGEVLGAVGFSCEGPRSWDDAERRFLEAVATQCAQALRRARLIESERTARDRLSFLAEATAALSASLDLDVTLARLAHLTVPRLADWCCVYLVDQGELRPVVHAHADPARADALRRLLSRWSVSLDDPTGVGAVARERQALAIPEITPELLAELARDEEHLATALEVGFTSAMVVPMVADDRVVGAITMGGAGSQQVGLDDLELAREVAARAAQAVRNAELYRSRAHVADVLQRSLLPVAVAEVPGVDVATRFVPVGEGVDVGGDFYDVFRLGRPRRSTDTWAVVIGDVRGKGAEAAVITGAARHAIRAAGLHTRSPAAMLGELNEVLLVLAAERDHDDREPMFCTAVVATVTPTGAGAKVVLAVGGHPAPMLLRADGATAPVGVEGTLLGVVDDPLLQDVELDLGPGEALVLYTDGVTERHAGDRFFDEEGLAAAVSRCAGFTAEAVAERIETAARAFVEDDLVDDIAIVVVRAPTPTATSTSTSTDLPLDANAPRLARRFVTEVLDAIGRDELAERAALLVSEVVTNAVLHGAAPLRVSVEPRNGAVRLAVADGGDGRPEVVDADDDALHGRGMQLVRDLADGWGVEDAADDGGKSVWFDLA